MQWKLFYSLLFFFLNKNKAEIRREPLNFNQNFTLISHLYHSIFKEKNVNSEGK